MIEIAIVIVQLVVVVALTVIINLQGATIRKLQANQMERERLRLEAKQRLLESFVLSVPESEKLNRFAARSRPH